MLTIAVSSRSLFHLEQANRLFEEKGQEAFDDDMEANENVPMEAGVAYPLVKKFLSLKAIDPKLIRVIILSRNSPRAGVRILKSVQHHGLVIESAVFTAGEDRFRYASEMDVDLFLSASAFDTAQAIKHGVAAATIVPKPCVISAEDEQREDLRIAFDGDSVLFSDEADSLYRKEGLASFMASEIQKANVPLGAGPFKNLLTKLCLVQKKLVEANHSQKLRIALVTARGVQAHGRAVTTLRSWGLSLDEMIFAGGLPKGPLVRAFGADFFFDDTIDHVKSASDNNVPAGHVPFGEGGIASMKAAPEGMD